jgi:hypothetical protein
MTDRALALPPEVQNVLEQFLQRQIEVFDVQQQRKRERRLKRAASNSSAASDPSVWSLPEGYEFENLAHDTDHRALTYDRPVSASQNDQTAL